MDIKKMIDNLKDCPCNKAHTAGDMKVYIGQGLLAKTSELLDGFPKNILVVADKNTLAAADGILEILENGGYTYQLKLYDDLRVADSKDAEVIAELSKGVDGVLSVGSGSLNDICRYGCTIAKKPFAIFATAPSMDGFAADSAPITFNNFKKSMPCKPPQIIIGDTDILAAAPSELKAAGFGDIMAKYVALVDWRASHLISGEPYCPRIADITRAAIEKVVSNADNIQSEHPAAAGTLMEALILAGLAMTLQGSIRPASGAEHAISHYWEVQKLAKGQLSDFHGKKVSVATLLIVKLYHELSRADVNIKQEEIDWDPIFADYGEAFREDIIALNNPSIMETTSVEAIAKHWDEIADMIKNELPSHSELLALMHRAGSATTIQEIGIPLELAISGMLFHPYMRYRITLTRLLPTLGILPDYAEYFPN